MKKLIPDELLPLKHRGKGYLISLDGHVYGVRGHRLKENTECDYGLNPPKVLGRNLWWLYCMTFYGKHESHTKVTKHLGTFIWCDDETYYRDVEKHQGFRPRKVPLTEKQKTYIQVNKHMPKQLIADVLNVSRMTVHRYIKELNDK